MKYVLLGIIWLYQRTLSPFLVYFLGHSCRFLPTCSEYSAQAIKKYGAIKGMMLAIKRISRCHPRTPFTFDPVS